MPRTRSHPRPRTRYRYGDRDTDARREHAAQTTEWRREQSRAALDPVAPILLAALAAGVPLSEACATIGVTVMAVHGRRQWDPGWSERVNAAIMAGRDSSMEHGTAGSYKRCRVRCPECREAHGATRGPRR